MSQERLNHIMLINVHQKKVYPEVYPEVYSEVYPEVDPEMHLGISKLVEVDPDNYRF